LNTRSLLFQQQPRWLKNRQGTRQQLPEAVQSWVYETGSLTARLRRHYGNRVAVKVLQQRWSKPSPSEAKLLRQPQTRYALIREVLLYTDSQPLILARTVIPQRTIKATHGSLARLGTRPLGEVLFADPNLAREAMQVVLVTPRIWTQTARDLGDITQPVWGRRTVYALEGNTMLVAEFFLVDALGCG